MKTEPARGRPKAALSEAIQKASDQSLPHCTIFGCRRPPEALHGTGLSRTLCRYHREYRSRHGSAWKRSYTGSELKPYIVSAESYLKAHEADLYIAHALRGLDNMLATAGPVRRVNDLPYIPLRDRTRATFARLRDGGVPPLRILSVAMGVLAAVEEDTFKPSHPYPAVQIAKALRRRGSGYHSDYGNGQGFHRYPRSSGQVLVAVGEAVAKACEFVQEYHLIPILDLKQQRHGVLPLPSSPAEAPRSRHGDHRLKPAPAPSSTHAATLSKRAEEVEAEGIAEEAREAFRRQGFEAFKGKF